MTNYEIMLVVDGNKSEADANAVSTQGKYDLFALIIIMKHIIYQ
mgnify:CR=1 FL=1